LNENRLWWGLDGQNTTPALKLFLSEVRDGMTPHNWWPYEEVGHTQEATKELAQILTVSDEFDYPNRERRKDCVNLYGQIK
jgi:adenine-specific DNA-methyltransferase